MKRKYLFVVGSIAIIGAVIVLALIRVNSVHSGPQASTPTPTYGLDPNATVVLPVRPTAIQPTIVDLAPDIPYEDKPSVVVQHPDGTREMFLLAPDAVDEFLKNLPKGDKLSAVIPAPSASMTHEAP
jgi:hypothetical protein